MKEELRRMKQSVILPAAFVLLIWLIMLVAWVFDLSYGGMGVYPRHLSGITGILTYPFFHGSWGHLAANTIPVFVLSTSIIYFYRPVEMRILLFIYLISGGLLWLVGREVHHIGASGLIYGFAGFLMFSGIMRRNMRLLALSLLMFFLYGGIFWGVLPADPQVSWEGHLSGLITGIVAAFVFRKRGPDDDRHPWQDQEPDEESVPYWDHNRYFPSKKVGVRNEE
ncbi:MAG: rhomboid family intramembrane serine protease [Bacteroidia bacterium]